MVSISIVVVNWNTQRLLFSLLTSIYHHPPKRDFEVIVVDNASADNSLEMVIKEFPKVKLLNNSINMGFAKAVNCGIRISNGKYILLLNTDVMVLDRAIDVQFEFMETNPSCAMSGGALVDGQGIPFASCAQFPSIRSMLAEILPNQSKLVGNRIAEAPAIDQTLPMLVDFVSGGAMMIRRSFFEGAGLLDERFFVYFEDADLGFRAKQFGWDVFCVPAARYYHIGSATLGWTRSKKYWIKYLGVLINKHYHGAQLLVCWLLWQLLRVKYNIWLIINRTQN